jgi:dTDP-4-dehydrorhamnose reductase
MNRAPLLVTGGSGQVGGAVMRAAAKRGIAAYAPTRMQLDLGDADALRKAVAMRPWQAIINCAAFTAVDRAESEPVLAHQINAGAPATLAIAAAAADIPIIHVSTDYVFDGGKTGPYHEDDPVGPLGVYGQTKRAGEAAVRAHSPRHAIIRTAWVLSADGANFLNTMLRLGAERSEIGVVADQIGNPSSADDIADTLLTIADQFGERSGTWHFVNAGAASWHDLAAHIFAATSARGLATPDLVAITTADYPTPARRPANSQLSTAKLTRDFGIVPRPWQDAVDEILSTRLDR